MLANGTTRTFAYIVSVMKDILEKMMNSCLIGGVTADEIGHNGLWVRNPILVY